MASYNLCDEPWIRVKYLDGNVRDVSLTQIFEDAEKIEDVLPPVFRGDTVHIYYVLTLKLITTIVMSAYFKEEQDFIAGSSTLRYAKELEESGLFSNVVKEYLEKWHDRFDLYSETYPFLQNALLKNDPDKKDEEKKEFITWNPIAPAKSKPIFGKVLNIDPEAKSIIDQYKISHKEFVYFLLYYAYMGNSFNAGNYKGRASHWNSSIFAILKRKTFAKSVLANIYPLDESTYPTEDEPNERTDKPVWELENIFEADYAEVRKNHLLMTFYPGISLLCVNADDFGPTYVKWRAIETPHALDPEIIKKRLQEPTDPSVIMTISKADEQDDKKDPILDENGKKVKRIYYGGLDYEKCNDVHLMCIEATKTLSIGDNNRISCPILKRLDDLSDDVEVYIYYRTFTDQKAGMRSFGVVDGRNSETWRLINQNDKHKIAEFYSNYCKDVSSILRKQLRKCISSDKNFKRNFDLYVTQDFFGNFTRDLSLENEEILKNFIKRIYQNGLEIFDQQAKYSKNYFEMVLARNNASETIKRKGNSLLKKYKKEEVCFNESANDNGTN